MKRIVVGLDGSPGGANALRWAAGLAGPSDAEIVVMSGMVPTESELSPARAETLLVEEQARVEKGLSSVADSIQARAVVERGDPRPGILEVARREDADLIVVGRKGASAGPGLLHTGSTAEWLAHHSDRPLAVVGGAVRLDPRRILIGVDGSPGSRAAVAWTADVASRSDLRPITATVDQPGLPLGEAGDDDALPQLSETLIRSDWCRELSAAGVEFDTIIRLGVGTADVLLTAAQDERADMIVVGMRGLGGFTGLRIGGVALKVLHRADRPVVLVPAT